MTRIPPSKPMTLTVAFGRPQLMGRASERRRDATDIDEIWLQRLSCLRKALLFLERPGVAKKKPTEVGFCNSG